MTKPYKNFSLICLLCSIALIVRHCFTLDNHLSIFFVCIGSLIFANEMLNLRKDLKNAQSNCCDCGKPLSMCECIDDYDDDDDDCDYDYDDDYDWDEDDCDDYADEDWEFHCVDADENGNVSQ